MGTSVRPDEAGLRAAKRQRWNQVAEQNESLTDDQITAQVEREFAGETPRGGAVTVATPFMDGVTFGMGDNVLAGIRALKDRVTGRADDITDAYDVRLAEEAGRLSAYRQENPKTALAATLAGGLATGGAGLLRSGARVAAAELAPGIMARLGRIVTMAGKGALGGAAGGFASADEEALGGGTAARLPATALGAGLGAGVGTVAPALFSGASRAIGAGARAAGRVADGASDATQSVIARIAGKAAPARIGDAPVTRTVPVLGDDKGLDLIARRLKRDGVTTDDLRARAATASPDELLVDIADGPSTRRLLAGAEAIPSQGGSLVRKTMDERQASQGSRVVSALLKGFKKDGAPNPIKAAKELELERATRANELYERAYVDEGTGAERFVETAPLLDFFERFPEFRTALRNAQKLARTDKRAFGIDPVEILSDRSVLPSQLSMRDMHYIKMGIDDAVADLLPGDKIATQFGRRLNTARAELLRNLGDGNPQYAEANAMYAGDSRMMEALAAGKNATKKTPAQIEDDLASLSESEAEQYRLAALDDLLRSVKRTANSRDAASKVGGENGTEEMRERLALLLPDDESRTSVESMLASEARKTATKRATQGSRTTPLREDVNEITGTGLADVLTAAGDVTSPTRMGMRLLRPVAERVDRFRTARTVDQLAPVLLAPRDAVKGVADRIDARTAAEAVRRARRALGGRAAGRGAAGATGTTTGKRRE
jgi:hypothetical protein